MGFRLKTFAHTVGSTLIRILTNLVKLAGKSPADDVAGYLNNKGLGLVPFGEYDDTVVYIYTTKEPENRSLLVPTVTTYDSGGFDSIVGEDFRDHQPTVQVIVAGAPGEPKAANDKAYEVKDLFEQPVTFTAGNFFYFGAYVQGDVNFIGTDENNVARYSVNLRLMREGGEQVEPPALDIVDGGKSTAMDIGEYLENASIGVIQTGTFDDSIVYIYDTKEPEVISTLVPTVVVYDSGGIDGVIGYDFKNYQPTIQIMVVGGVGEPDDAYDKALEIKDLMQSPAAFTAGDMTYYGSYLIGDIVHEGTDTLNVARYSVNIRLYRTKE